MASAHGLYGAIAPRMDEQAFHEALEALWAVVRAANAYVDHQAPWALGKDDPQRMGSVLYVLAEVIRHLAILVQPFMPGAAARLLDQVGVEEGKRAFTDLGPAGALVPGTALPKPEALFPRFVEDEAS